MSLLNTLERHGLKSAMGLPSRLLRLLGGRPIVVDAQTLAPDLQLMLRLQRIAREVGAETLPMDQGRLALRHHTGLTGGQQPIGSVRDLVAGERPARLYVPSTPVPGALLVFFHGGGFMHGDLETHDPACRRLSETSGVRVLAVDYRLSPEQKFPAAYDDAVAAYSWAVEHAADLGVDPDLVGVGGDSAGGNLAAGVALEAARRELPCRVQVLIYPGTDSRRQTKSAQLFAEGFYLTAGYMNLADESYSSTEADLDDPRFSPIRADIPAGVAPALVFTAGFDPLRDEGEQYADRLEAAGVQVELTRFEDQIHGFFNIVDVGHSAPRANRRVALATRLAFVD